MFKISITPEEIEALPMTSFPGKITVIDSQGIAFFKALDYLGRQKVIGFDTETKPSFTAHHYHNGVALLQLSGPDKAFLFRLKSLSMYRLLFRVLANPKVIKVGAAVSDDIHGLQRYNNFKPAGFMDLQQIVWEWGIRDKSVKKMSAIILGIRISKREQLSNWEAENLSDSQKRYAATDAWVCREMYMKLLESEKNPLTPEQLNPPQHRDEDTQSNQ